MKVNLLTLTTTTISSFLVYFLFPCIFLTSLPVPYFCVPYQYTNLGLAYYTRVSTHDHPPCLPFHLHAHFSFPSPICPCLPFISTLVYLLFPFIFLNILAYYMRFSTYDHRQLTPHMSELQLVSLWEVSGLWYLLQNWKFNGYS